MVLKTDCSVFQDGKRKFLTPSSRKNPKFKAGTPFLIVSDPANQDFSVFQTSGFANRFHVKKSDFLDIFGISYDDFREDKVKKMKDFVLAISSVVSGGKKKE